MNTFKSEFQPGMNFFLERLQIALENLPDNPKPDCKGFYLCEYLGYNRSIRTEKIGTIPISKNAKYLHFSTKKVTQTIFFDKQRSAEFENNALEQYRGAIKLDEDCTGVSGHDSWIDEAISGLWLITKYFLHRKWNLGMIEREPQKFWNKFKEAAREFSENDAPDNKWIVIIADLMAEQKD